MNNFFYIYLTLALFSLSANGHTSLKTKIDIEIKVDQLENKISLLEKKMDALLNNCEIHYKPIGIYKNRCPKNSFVSEVIPLTDQILQLRCRALELNCSKE